MSATDFITVVERRHQN